MALVSQPVSRGSSGEGRQVPFIFDLVIKAGHTIKRPLPSSLALPRLADCCPKGTKVGIEKASDSEQDSQLRRALPTGSEPATRPHDEQQQRWQWRQPATPKLVSCKPFEGAVATV